MIKKRDLAFFAGLVIVILLGVFIRVQNLDLLENKVTGEYTPLALDPYYFLRISRYLETHDKLFENDDLRYYPIGHDPNVENIFLSRTIVFQHKIMQMFDKDISLEYATVIYPVIFFALACIVFFLLVMEIFDKKIALLATLFLGIMPSFLYRTMAGFSDKEALGLFFMFLTFYFYVKAMKTKPFMESVFFGLLAGVSTGFMGLTWGGSKFLLVIIAFYNIVLLLLNKDTKKDFFVYLAWIIPMTLIMAFMTGKYRGITGMLKSSTTGIAYMVLGLLLFSLLMQRVKIIEKVKLPRNLTVLGILVVIATLIGSLAIGGLSVQGISIIGIVNDAKDMLTSGGFGSNRLSLTVAENKQPYVVEWMSQFRLLFWLFLAGSLMFFYQAVKPLEKYRRNLTILFGVFVIGFVFSRLSPSTVLNGENAISNLIYFGSALVFALVGFGYYLYWYYKDRKTFEDIHKIDTYMIFLLSWLLVMFVAGRSAIRLLMLMAPIVAVLSAFVIFKVIEASKGLSDKIYRWAAFTGIALVVVFLIFSNATTSYASAQQTGPSYNVQWQYAMNWVKENTIKDAVFAHWWDYGYWVQTGAERATITDGGNYYSYWNHLMGRHVLSAQNETEALEYLKAHDATHLLIISDEIGKYTAYSSVGSDENFDIFSWINTFVMHAPSNTKEGDVINYVYYGGTALDENLVYEGKIFPMKEAAIAGFILPVKEEEEDYEILQPKAIVIYHGARTEVPVECVYDEKVIEFNETGLKGCIRLMPRILNQGYQQENGALLYVSEKGRNALWTRLFLFDEKIDSFELVYDDSGQNKLAYYNGRLMGPLKIWRIHYPDGFEISEELKQEYLALTTPEWMRLSGVTM